MANFSVPSNHLSAHGGTVNLFANAAISGVDEFLRIPHVRVVFLGAGRHWPRSKFAERREESNCSDIFDDQILEQKEPHVASKVTKQRKEVRVPFERLE